MRSARRREWRVPIWLSAFFPALADRPTPTGRRGSKHRTPRSLPSHDVDASGRRMASVTASGSGTGLVMNIRKWQVRRSNPLRTRPCPISPSLPRRSPRIYQTHNNDAGGGGVDVERRGQGRRLRHLPRRVRLMPARRQVPGRRFAGGVGPMRARVSPPVHHPMAQLAGGATVPNLPRRVGVQAAHHVGDTTAVTRPRTMTRWPLVVTY